MLIDIRAADAAKNIVQRMEFTSDTSYIFTYLHIRHVCSVFIRLVESNNSPTAFAGRLAATRYVSFVTPRIFCYF